MNKTKLILLINKIDENGDVPHRRGIATINIVICSI